MDWKQKLAAYLHDPPSKPLNIKEHRELAELFYRQAGFSPDEAGKFAESADWTAAAADRFPFPNKHSGLSCHFDGVRNQFHHPLGGSTLSFKGPFVTGDLAHAKNQDVQPVLKDFSAEDDDHWRARFIAHWRLWPEFCANADYRFAFLPADTRLPDHTIWNHMAVVSALQGTVKGQSGAIRPAFFRFHIGSVQQFISEARSTRDLWSGSYLISWLVAAALRKVSLEIGPDAVIFPNLRSQPLLDWFLKDEIWTKVCIGEGSVWEQTLCSEARRRRTQRANNDQSPDVPFLTPNLPNTFLAVLPADESTNETVKKVVEAVRKEWTEICKAVWKKVAGGGLLQRSRPSLSGVEAEKRFWAQVDRFPQISWHLFKWPEGLTEAKALAAGTGNSDLMQRYEMVIRAATELIPEDHRDGRYFEGGEDGPKEVLKNTGTAWSLLVAASAWCLNAVRQAHTFSALRTGGWQEVGSAQTKDALNGRDEMIVGGQDFANEVRELDLGCFFKHDDPVSALTLVKRLWHCTYLEEMGLRATGRYFPMPNTGDLAAHKYDKDSAEDNLDQESDDRREGSYFAVLALDGDDMGQWVSGGKAPSYGSQLASYTDGSGMPAGALPYFQNIEGMGDFLATSRLVSPGYHLQFSEALSHFALHCARRIVEAYHGRLIYAGGDDVLALLPADTALGCARALRCGFRGEEVNGLEGLLFRKEGTGGGFLSDANLPNPAPFIVPGPRASCSVGIAIAHYKAPLQDVVREAHDAQSRAKKINGKDAVAVTLMKRSGEISHWRTRFESGGLQLFDSLRRALAQEVFSERFPHRVIELVSRYLSGPKSASSTTTTESFPQIAEELLLRETEVAFNRQRGAGYGGGSELLCEIRKQLRGYLAKIDQPEEKVSDLIGLCETVAFTHRIPNGQE